MTEETEQHKRRGHGGNVDLTRGPIAGGILKFAWPLFLGQLLQSLYNMVDAWVIGNFTTPEAFAAISSTGTIVFFILGFFGGIAMGGSVVISRAFGEKNEKKISIAIHTNFLMALITSVVATVLALVLMPHMLVWIGIPAEVMNHAADYLRIYFSGICTVMIYNTCMSVMRALGDSVHPLYYLIFSSLVNIGLDLLFVVHPAFRWGIRGAAIATVIAQGLSCILSIVRLCRMEGCQRLEFRKLKWNSKCMKDVISMGLPTGVQNAVLTIGNLTVQKNVNALGTYAMSGFGAYAKIEQLVFLPIMSMSMAVTTFVSQNLGAGKAERARKGARFSILLGVGAAELIGVVLFFSGRTLVRLFITDSQSLAFGELHSHITSLFFFLLAFTHCAAGVMRGSGRAAVPMYIMLGCWCVARVTYVTVMFHFHPAYASVASAYPFTWGLSSLCFSFFVIFSDWANYYRRKNAA